MVFTVWNPRRISLPALTNRLRVVDSRASISMSPSRLAPPTTRRTPVRESLSTCSSISTGCASSARSIHRTIHNRLSLYGSIPVRALSSASRQSFQQKTCYVLGKKSFRTRKLLGTSPISSVIPCLQQLSFMSSLSPTTKLRSRVFNDPNTDNKMTRQMHLTSLIGTTIARVMKRYSAHCAVRAISLESSTSLYEYESRLRFRSMFRDSNGTRQERFFRVTSLGATRYFTSPTLASFRQSAVAPQIIPCRAALPHVRPKPLSRNASSNTKGDKGGKDIVEKNDASKNQSPSSIKDAETASDLNNNKIQEFMDSTVSTVRTNVGSAEATIKRAVEELSTGDLLSVYGIVFLILTIAIGPSMIRRLRSTTRDDNHYDDIDPEDPVMDLARIIRGEYLKSRNMNENQDEENSEKDKEESGRGSSTMGLDRIVADLLKSPQIQEAATNLATKVIQSSQFKSACQLLLKELLKDLLDDPDTLKQVIHLLQNAIVDEKIKEAAIQLATDIFGDDRVLDELVTLVQRLGMEQQVKYATQALLVESAHNALNDPEILDHSMEFATDVVGDDVVQQTAGEALYNTMSYAFRPTLSVLLTLLGVGLIFVSIAAFRNVNQTPSDAADRAFLNAVEKTASRLLKVVFLPLDFLMACKEALVSIILFPFRMISSTVSRVGKLGQNILKAAQDWFLWLLHLPAQFLSAVLCGSQQILTTTCAHAMDRLNGFISALLCGSQQFLKTTCAHVLDRLNGLISVLLGGSPQFLKTSCTNIMDRLNGLIYAVDISFVGVPFQNLGSKMSVSLHVAKIRWISLNWQVSDQILSVENYVKRFIREAVNLNNISDKLTKVKGKIGNYSVTMQQEGKEYIGMLSRGHNSLNQSLVDFATFIETWIRSTYRFF